MKQTLRTFRTPNFDVIAEIRENNDVDTSFDETGETLEKLRSGEWQAFGVEVIVYFRGLEIGSDSIWGNIYAKPEDFMDHRGMNASGHGSYFSDLIRTAIRDARHTLRAMQGVKVR